MKKRTYWLLLPFLLGGMAVLGTCGFENLSDPLAAEEAFQFPEGLRDARDAREAALRALIAPALADVATKVVTNEDNPIRPQPNTRATACCWAHKTRTELHPYDNTNNLVNTWDDTYAWHAIDNASGTWWNTNFARPDNSTWPGRKHTEIPANERIDVGNHWLTVEIGDNPALIVGLTYMGRNGNNNSRINNYQIYVSEAPLGHYCPPGSFVYQGTFANNQNTQQVDFIQPLKGVAMAKYGKYVQMRILDSWADGPYDGGIAELRIITMDKALYDSLTEEISDAIEEAMGDTPLVVDYDQLALCYNEGLLVLSTVRNNPVKHNRLNELMHGKFDSAGNLLVKGAAQYLYNDPDRITSVRSEIDLNNFFQYQRNVDDLAIKLGAVIITLKK